MTRMADKTVVAEACRKLLLNPLQEHVFALALDEGNYPCGEPWIVAVGTADECTVHPRDVYREAIVRNAARVIVAHNHPGNGPLIPSEADVALTWHLRRAANALDMTLVDHVIFTADKEVSLSELGEM